MEMYELPNCYLHMNMPMHMQRYRIHIHIRRHVHVLMTKTFCVQMISFISL